MCVGNRFTGSVLCAILSCAPCYATAFEQPADAQAATSPAVNAESPTRPATAATLPASRPAGAQRVSKTDMTVAILDFDSKPAGPELGQQVAEVLVAVLSGEPGIRLVDRSNMSKVLIEHQLALSGIVSAEQANAIGKLVGARLLICGKVFPVDKQIFYTAKIIGSETTLLDGVLVRGDLNAPAGDLMMRLATEVAARVHTKGPDLVAQPDAGVDPLPSLQKSLMGKKLPPIAIVVGEQHIAANTASKSEQTVQHELQQLFSKVGFTVIEGDERQQAENGVKLQITGDAFSEFAGRIDNLVSCAARAEVRLIDRRSGQVLLEDRETARGIDLSENLAARTALQRAARSLGVRLLQHFADTLPETPQRKTDLDAPKEP